MLVSRSKTITNYVLPVSINGYKKLWFYDNEHLLFKAYYQLKSINGKIVPSYPVIY